MFGTKKKSEKKYRHFFSKENFNWNFLLYLSNAFFIHSITKWIDYSFFSNSLILNKNNIFQFTTFFSLFIFYFIYLYICILENCSTFSCYTIEWWKTRYLFSFLVSSVSMVFLNCIFMWIDIDQIQNTIWLIHPTKRIICLARFFIIIVPMKQIK